MRGAGSAQDRRMSPFRYCLNASTIRGTPVARQIEVAALAGYGAIELWFDDVDAHVAAGGTIAELRAMLDARGLVVPTVIYLGGWLDCGVRLEQAAQMGSNHVIACPAMGRADVAQGARHYRELLELPGARAAMEFLGFVEQYNTIESALEVVERAGHPDGTVVIDTFHIFRGGGSVEGLAKLRGGQVAVAHFNDTPAQPSREQQHDKDRVWPGEGHLDLRRYLDLLQQIGFHGWLSLELFREDLWARDPLEVASTGLEKMRAVVEA
jgi:sugar phosphate isomerase/epimerase